MKNYILLILILIVMSNLESNKVLAFNNADQGVINELLLQQQIFNQKIENLENNKKTHDATVQKMIEAVGIKNDAIDNKENAYDKAINQSKWIIIGFGVLCLIILAGLGWWQDKKLVDKKEELSLLCQTNIDLIKKEADIVSRDKLLFLEEKFNKKFDDLWKDYRREIDSTIKQMVKSKSSQEKRRNNISDQEEDGLFIEDEKITF